MSQRLYSTQVWIQRDSDNYDSGFRYNCDLQAGCDLKYSNVVGDRAICALAVEYHMLHLGYTEFVSLRVWCGPQQTRYFAQIIALEEISSRVLAPDGCGPAVVTPMAWLEDDCFKLYASVDLSVTETFVNL